MRAFCFGRGPLGNFVKVRHGPPRDQIGPPARRAAVAGEAILGAAWRRRRVPVAPGRPPTIADHGHRPGGPAAAGVRARHAGLLPRLAPGDAGAQVRGAQRRPAAAAVDAALDPLPARAGASPGRGRADLVPARAGRRRSCPSSTRTPATTRWRTTHGRPTSRRRSPSWRAEVEHSRRIEAAAPDLDLTGHQAKWGEDVTLRLGARPHGRGVRQAQRARRPAA